MSIMGVRKFASNTGCGTGSVRGYARSGLEHGNLIKSFML